MDSNRTGSADRVPPAWVDAAVLGIAFVLLSVWSWQKWRHPLVDFGRELYTPWQLAQGKVLYRDIEAIFGPFSP